MQLWTYQPQEVYDIINQGTPYICDIHKSIHIYDGKYGLDTQFLNAYNWAASKLAAKCKKPEGVSYPVWAYHTIDWKRDYPNPRDLSCKPELLTYLIALDVPDDQVLLIDSDGWYAVLNNYYNNPGVTEEEYDRYAQEFDQIKNPRKKERVKIQSWDAILDVTPMDRSPFAWRGRYVEAIFWVLKPEYVTNITRFYLTSVHPTAEDALKYPLE